MDNITPDELHKAFAAFLICFGAGLPDTLKHSIRQRAHELARQIEHGGEPNVATLTKGFADALCTALPPPPRH